MTRAWAGSGTRDGVLVRFRSSAARAAAPRGVPGVVAVVLSVLAVALGLLGLGAWFWSPDLVTGRFGGATAFTANAAALTVVIGAALLARGRAAAVLAVLALLVVGLTLAEYATNTDLGLDRWLVHDQPGTNGGRMTVAAAACFGLLSSSRLASALGRAREAELAAGLSGLAAVTVLVGCLYDVHTLFLYRSISSAAVPGAIGLTVLSLAALAVVPDGGFAWFVGARDAGAGLVRRLIPFAVIAVPLLGFACVKAERKGWFDPTEAIVSLVAIAALTISLVAWTAGRRLQRVDRGRLTAIDDLMRLTDDLEDQVQRRASQLELGRAQLAILEDRHRIASDLHDIVIQKLFAAGMYLDGALTMVRDNPKATERVETAVEAMDTAIKDLRASIFELNSAGEEAITLQAAITKVGHETSRILGFMPKVEVTDLDGRAEPARDDILAVVREALTNTARHAKASQVLIELIAGTRGVELTVEDDGIGMGRPDRASGTANMRDRAQRWGGTCVWEAVQPHGTRVRWSIPDPIGSAR
ncbi:MAG: sensor histidine kinase [Jatrophihabitans sp.]|uniref:sensor histidine kinase n=1 Tax=Jatrophihabitans sp. TaxID=1932789 RepID=UPI003F7D052F